MRMFTLENYYRNNKVVRIVRAINGKAGSIVLYATPPRPNIKRQWHVETIDHTGHTNEKLCFRYFKREQDAVKVYNWLLSLANEV